MKKKDARINVTKYYVVSVIYISNYVPFLGITIDKLHILIFILRYSTECYISNFRHYYSRR